MTDPARRPRHPMPGFVRDALDDQGLRQAYDARPPYQRNDYVGWIARAKREDTRQRRLAQMLDELRRGDVYMKMAWGGGRSRANAKRSAPDELAEDIREAFEAAGMLEAFRDQPPSHQRQHLRHVDEAKRPETRARRIAKTCTRLQDGSSGASAGACKPLPRATPIRSPVSGPSAAAACNRRHQADLRRRESLNIHGCPIDPVGLSARMPSHNPTYVGEKRGAHNAAFSFQIYAVMTSFFFPTMSIRFSSTSIRSTSWCK